MSRLVREFRRFARRFGFGRRPGPVTLLYHRVTELATDPQLMSVRPEHFRQHLDVLRQSAVPLPLAALADRAMEGCAPARSVAVTFDDGYADNLLEAAPLLRAADVPATVFAAGGWIGSGEEFWWDELERILLLGAELPPRLEIEIGGCPCSLDLRGGTSANDHKDWNVTQSHDPTPRHAAYRLLCERLRRLPVAERNRAIRELQAAAGLAASGRATHRAMTAAELLELSRSGLIDVGGHTQHHPSLAALDLHAQREEIAAGKRTLEEILGRPPTTFSYPFGGEGDFGAATAREVRRAGFARACANWPGALAAPLDPYRIPRFVVRDWDGETFARKLQEWFGGQSASLRHAG